MNPHTTELRKVPEAELRSRNHEILQHLSEWLLTKTASDVESRYRRLGAERAAQGVSLADYCWAIVLTKEHLWEFLQRQAFLCSPVEIYGELELLRLLDRFFDRALCYAAEGYEEYARTAKPGETSALESPAAALN
ncbi:MAG TPA: hypothetical protein VLW84_05475 [Terriglobales bacterium]|nr:hypothetical protein [Terriglobales bacterium]